MYELENNRDIHARSSSSDARVAAPRVAGMSRAELNFCHARLVFKSPLGEAECFASAVSLLSVRFISRRSLRLPSLVSRLLLLRL